jgi:glyoxylase-like metal-dependent hydrolase (beta-lactamase superfamily II)
MEIAPGLHRLLGVLPRGVNAYLHLPADGSSPLLFDCGWPWSGERLANGLRALSVLPEQLGGIVITHDDVDHTGRLAHLRAVSGAAVFAHADELPRLLATDWRSVPGNPGLLDWVNLAAQVIYGRCPHPPITGVNPLDDGADLPGGWRLLHTPGHTPGHACYFHEALRVLIAGDAIGPTPDGALRAPKPAYCEDRAAANASIFRLAVLAPEIVCCGHGPIIREGATALRRLAAHLS